MTDPQTEKGIRRLAAQLMLNNTTNIILDTDLAGDVDDVCDVGLMCAFVKLRVIKLLGVVATTPFPWSAPCITTLLDYSVSGHDIAVCQYNGAATLPQFSVYCEKVVQRFAKERGSLKPPPPGHVKGYRRLLHGAPDRSVIIAMTGTATSISELLLSAADDVSPYSGAELVVSKVKALVWEAGRFPQSQTPEYNIQTDIGAARSLIERWPSSVPVIWACNNIGDVVYSGPPASVDPMISPYRYAYDLYTGKQNGKRQAWGQIACYWAALGISQGQTELFERATKLLGYGGTRGFVQIDETGNNYWLSNPGNNCYLVRTAAADVLADELNKLLAISTGEQQKDSGQLCTRG